MTAAIAEPSTPSLRDTAAPSVVARLLRAEARLTARDPLVLTFVLVFPIVTMLIIGGAFGTTPDPAFAGANPSHWYVASYFTVVIAATGLVMLPVHLASYREHGVLRRFAAAGFPRWSFVIAEMTLGFATIAVAGVLLLAVAAPVYGVPGVHDLGRVALALVLGSGGPPPKVMGSAVKHVADVLPLTWVTNSIRDPWLGLGTPVAALVGVAALAVVATVLAVRRSSL